MVVDGQEREPDMVPEAPPDHPSTPDLSASEDRIAERVAGVLRKDLQEYSKNLRIDVLNDVKELVAKTVAPQVGGSMTGGLPGAPPLTAPAPDFSKMSPEQIKAYKDGQMFELIKAFGPMLIQNQQQNPIIQEMLNRILMEQVAGSMNLQKALLARSVGDVVGMQQAWSNQNMLSQQMTGPIMQAAQAAYQRPIQPTGGAPFGQS